MHRLTRYLWLDFLLGLIVAAALTVSLAVAFAAWYLAHLGFDAPVLWDGYGLWLGVPTVSIALAVRLRHRCPTFAVALVSGACAGSLLLVVILWLLDNAVGFSG